VFETTAAKTESAPIRGIIHAWAAHPGGAAWDSKQVSHNALASLAYLTQAWSQYAAAKRREEHLGVRDARIWVLTEGTQAVQGDEVAAPYCAALWGFGRTLGVEHPEFWGGFIVFEPGAQGLVGLAHGAFHLRQRGLQGFEQGAEGVGDVGADDRAVVGVWNGIKTPSRTY